jgi:protein SCO1/2
MTVRHTILLGLAGLLLAGLWPLAPAMAARIDATEALQKSEAAIGGATGDHRLLSADGQPLHLSELRGRPLIVSLIYTSCSTVCPAGTETLKAAVAEARRMLGDEAFAVLTLGFDARNDTPGRMAAFAIDHDIAGDPLWHVASASPAVLQSLLAEVGFSYDGAAGGFEHVVQTTILDKTGRVYRQVYGDAYPVQVLMEPLKQLVFGLTTRDFTPAALLDRLQFLCTVFDPKTGRYKTDYTIFFEIGIGGLVLALLGWKFAGMWRSSRRPALADASGGPGRGRR